METFAAKRLLTPTGGGDDSFFHTDWSMNLYRGCNHGCIYCDSRSACYRIDRFDVVRGKRDALEMLRRELLGKRKPGVVGMGAASDPYNCFEETERLTQGALELFARYGFGTGFSTKSDTVVRDKALLARIGKSMPVRVAFSITTADDTLSALTEPDAPVSSARFAAMRQLAEAGVFTGTWMNPMLPFLTDTEAEVRDVVKKTAESGGRFVICFYEVTLREGDREYFYAALDRHERFRGVKQKYIDAFGLDYICPSPRAQGLWELMKQECAKAGLCCDFRTLNREMKAGQPVQLKLFE